ncbi:MAG: efflux RND transporter periplasmic adaptor subunit [Bdellovibrionaceae bacterium]|nr:efflux RND transporter periplasmic adaptor subunit [Pseudobdellovibrionaceae bacterium]
MIRKTVEYIKIPKKVFFGILTFIVLALVAFSFKPNLTQVDVAYVQRALFEKMITDEGITSFKEKQIITAPADGIIPSHPWKVGSQVEQGQKLFSFEWDKNFSVQAPISGYILQVFEKDRKHVLRGTPLIEIGNPEKVEVIAALLSEEVVEVQVGQKAIIKKWGGETPLQAEVTKIEPRAKEEVSALGVKEQRVNVFLDITSDRELWKNLGDGFRVEVSIIIRKVENAVLMPIGALFNDQEKPTVFAVEQGKLKKISLKLGDRNQEYAELKSPFDKKTPVVLYPASSLNEGDKIKVRVIK